MRRLAAPILLSLALAGMFPAAATAKCPLDVATCLNEFARMHERPWLGVNVDADSSGAWVVKSVMDGAPAAKAGVLPGDVIVAINGVKIGNKEGNQTKAGWKIGTKANLTVTRGGLEQQLSVLGERIPDDKFAKMVGDHLVEEHLAGMDGVVHKVR